MAAQSPMNGDDVPIENPYALVAKGSDDVGMLVAGGGEGLPIEVLRAAPKLRGIALRSPANRVICPQAELPKLRRTLLRVDCSERILSSHLISRDAQEALIAHDLEKFFELRRTEIWKAEQNWLKAHGGNVDFQQDPRKYSQG